MTASCWYQGQPQSLPLDRGWLYGDALFETLMLRQGQFRLFALHLERLALGFERLQFAAAPSLLEQVQEQCAAIAAAHGEGDWVVRLQVSRQLLGRGYKPDAQATGVIMAQVTPWAGPVLKPGLSLDYSQVQLSEQPLLAGLKHANRLDQVLARQQYQGAAQELLMLNGQGQVICGTMTNLLAIKNNVLYTPRLARAGVAGVMRRWLLEQWCAWGLPVSEQLLYPQDLLAMEYLMVSNALHGPVPVGQLAGHALNPDHVKGQRLMAAFEAL